MKHSPNPVSTTKPHQSSQANSPLLAKHTQSNGPNVPGTKASNQNSFMASPIIRSESIDRPKTNTKPQKSLLNQNRKPILSREALKKAAQIKDAMKKKAMTSRTKTKDLSLIHEESEQSLSSSYESGLISDSSMNESNSEEDGSQYQSISQKWEKQYQGELSDCEDNLDKTVLMTRNKASRPSVETQQVQQKKHKLAAHLNKLKQVFQKYSLKQISQLYQHGKISQNDYKNILNLKNQQSQMAKENKFTQNLQKIRRKAIKIFVKYGNLHQKLVQDVSHTQLKYKALQQKYHSIQTYAKNSPNPYCPQLISFQLKLYTKNSQIQAKEQILNNLSAFIEELQIKYNQHITRLDEEKKKNSVFSQNLIFKPIFDFLKFSVQQYTKIVRSFIIDKHNNKSVLTQTTKRFLTQKISQRYVTELKLMEDINLKNLIQIFKYNYGQEVDLDNISETIIAQIFTLSATKTSQTLQNSKRTLHNNISFVQMVHKRGELSEGRTYRNAVELLKIHPSSQMNLQDFSQQTIVENFKFFQKKVHLKLKPQYELIERLHLLFETRKQAKIMKNQNKKRESLISMVENFEKVVFSLNRVFSFCEFKKSNKEKRFSQYSNFRDYLEDKKTKLQKLLQKSDELLKWQQTGQSHQQLIPKKRVGSFDFRTNKEPEGLGFGKESHKITWKQLISKKQGNCMMYGKTSPTQNLAKAEFKNDSESNGCSRMEESQKNFAQEMSGILKENSEKFSDDQTKKHFDKVYQLILKNQIYSEKPSIETHKEPYQPQNYSIFQQLLESVQLTGSKPSINSFHAFKSLYPEQFDQNKNIQKSALSDSQNEHKFQWLNQNQSVQEIEKACRLFAREFHLNPGLREGLKLNDHQFYFLMSPDYRRYFMEKKVKDQQMTDKLIEIVKLNTMPKEASSPNNPIKYMIQSDGYFRHKIEQYQQRIIKSQKFTDPNQPRLVYDYDDESTCDSQEYELLDRRVREMEEKSVLDYYFKKYDAYHEKESDIFEDGEVRVIYG